MWVDDRYWYPRDDQSRPIALRSSHPLDPISREPHTLALK